MRPSVKPVHMPRLPPVLKLHHVSKQWLDKEKVLQFGWQNSFHPFDLKRDSFSVVLQVGVTASEGTENADAAP